MSRFTITKDLWKQIDHWASFPQTGVSLRQMVMFGQNPSQGTLLKASQFLAEELPVRLAHRVKELDELPNKLNEMPSIIKVKNWYAQSFEELVNFPKPDLPPDVRAAIVEASSSSDPLPVTKPNPSLPKHMVPNHNARSSSSDALQNATNGRSKQQNRRIPVEHRYYANPGGNIKWPPQVHDYNERFTSCLSNIKNRHDPVVTSIASGVLEYKKRIGHSAAAEKELAVFLDRFYMSRIGIRVLIGQHIALNRLEPHKNYVGIINTKTNIYETCREAIENATFVCEDYYGLFKGPPVELICPKDLEFSYIPSHLNHMVFEILKNSLRATVEKYGADCESFPPIKIIVAHGDEDITIKVSDEGGGIPRKDVPLVWTYMYTTAEAESVDQNFEGSDFKAPLAGFGYGLPIARLYSQYLGGGLKLMSMEGYGCDVYIYLSRRSDSSEPLQ